MVGLGQTLTSLMRQAVDAVAAHETMAGSAVAGGSMNTIASSDEGGRMSMEKASLLDQLQVKRQVMLGAKQTVECADDANDEDTDLPAPNSDLKKLVVEEAGPPRPNSNLEKLEAELESLRALDSLAKKQKSPQNPEKLESAASTVSLAFKAVDASNGTGHTSSSSADVIVLQQQPSSTSFKSEKANSSGDASEASDVESPIFTRKVTKKTDAAGGAIRASPAELLHSDGSFSATKLVDEDAPGPLPDIKNSRRESSTAHSETRQDRNNDTSSPVCKDKCKSSYDENVFHRIASNGTSRTNNTEVSIMFDGLKRALAASVFNPNDQSDEIFHDLSHPSHPAANAGTMESVPPSSPPPRLASFQSEPFIPHIICPIPP